MDEELEDLCRQLKLYEEERGTKTTDEAQSLLPNPSTRRLSSFNSSLQSLWKANGTLIVQDVGDSLFMFYVWWRGWNGTCIKPKPLVPTAKNTCCTCLKARRMSKQSPVSKNASSWAIEVKHLVRTAKSKKEKTFNLSSWCYM